MHLGGIPVWEKSGAVSKRVNFLQSGKITYMETFQNLLKSHLSFGESLESCNAEKRGCNRKKMFYSEMWENAVQRGVACESHVRFCMYEINLETTEYICVNVGVSLVGSCHKAAEVYSHHI